MYKRGFIIFGVVSLTMGNSALPFADGLVGDAQPVGCVLLGHARVLSEGRQIGAGFCGIHIMVTLLSVWSQYAADGAGRPSRR